MNICWSFPGEWYCRIKDGTNWSKSPHALVSTSDKWLQRCKHQKYDKFLAWWPRILCYFASLPTWSDVNFSNFWISLNSNPNVLEAGEPQSRARQTRYPSWRTFLVLRLLAVAFHFISFHFIYWIQTFSYNYSEKI